MEEMVETRICHTDHTTVKNQKLERTVAQSSQANQDLKTEKFLSHNTAMLEVKMVLSKYSYLLKEFS